MNATTTTSQSDSPSSYQDNHGDHYRDRDGYHGSAALERPVHDRMLAGVAAGAARYLGVDPTVVRIILAVLVFVGGVGLPLYAAGWLLIPEEGREQSLASELIASFQARQSTRDGHNRDGH
jgi:phage shock protein PspC (stress-responsive transcriptional regulator)